MPGELQAVAAGDSDPAVRQALAGNPSLQEGAGRRLMQSMMALYQSAHAVNGRIPATYEVIYGRGSKQ